MNDYRFHPAVEQWFQRCFGKPTKPQEKGWPLIQAGKNSLISAPTGSGKTLAAFLAVLDRLFRRRLENQLENATKILYISPLKALSNDIHKNLLTPLEGIQRVLEEMGQVVEPIRAAVRTGDTSPAQRRAIIKNPPHILVTTPESFYLLLTSKSGRSLLETVETLIVDEIHALVGNRRGAHLALSMERLCALIGHPLQRIGLSATQKPMQAVAHFLVGSGTAEAPRNCDIVDEGHLRTLDLELVLPDSPLEAVMSNQVWDELYQKLVGRIEDHRTTLIFVNNRRLAERMSFHLAKTLGAASVAAHHGSLSLETRRDAENRLRSGKLKALVATASLELGIDIGYVDLVCQMGSPRSIATFLQRIGRSGHYYGGTPKGNLFPLTRDELVECTALLRSVRQGLLDRLIPQQKPLDVLAQQIVAAAASRDWQSDELLEVFKKAYPYRNLDREAFLAVVHMLADGIHTKRGRRSALIFFDGVNDSIKGRKNARITALTSGGAIPDNADYRVMLEEENLFVGTVNEDFAVESLPGDIFQLGSHSWRILKVARGTVVVADAAGQPPTIPFWLGEAPGRTAELSQAVSRLRSEWDEKADQEEEAALFLAELTGPTQQHHEQLQQYFWATKLALGCLPTQETLVMERFFDESGGMQLVIHAPFGSRLNRAWGLALRKRFCRSFNFELQAAATDNAIVLSLGHTHSFPLDEVFTYLHSGTVRKVLIQAILDAPMFQTRWRWNASRSLALPRRQGGKRVPPPIQRMNAEDLIAAVFPDQLACLENIAGDREIPDHPLVDQTIWDCLHEAMDIEGLEALLRRIEGGQIRCVAMDLPEPSPFAHEILNAQPYAFLDDAPLEERRTQAVLLRRILTPDRIVEGGLLDAAAIDEVRRQTWPEVANADELHEALLILGGLERETMTRAWLEFMPELMAAGRATRFSVDLNGEDRDFFVVAERLPQWRALFSQGRDTPSITPPEREQKQSWPRDMARLELLRGRIECCGPVTAARLQQWFGLPLDEVEISLLRLESQGSILRGHFEKNPSTVVEDGSDQPPSQAENRQWCDRRLLARIHRLTLTHLRNRIKPVSPDDFMRFLFQWQRAHPDHQSREMTGLESILLQLEGFEAAAGTWENALLPLRLKSYMPQWLDNLCLLGKIGWARVSPSASVKGTFGPLKTSPIAFFPRFHGDLWSGRSKRNPPDSGYARQVLEVLQTRGALFFDQIHSQAGLLPTQVEMGLGELVSLGLVRSDSFAGLRALLLPAHKKPGTRQRRRRPINASTSIAMAGRWSIVPSAREPCEEEETPALDLRDRTEPFARILLRRYGVVFRRLLERESNLPKWRDLLPVFRRLEAVGEIRGGHFVSGFGGEHFALPEAIGTLRAQRDKKSDGRLVVIHACDPLNLAGIITPGKTIALGPNNRILFRDGRPVAALEAGQIIHFQEDHQIDPFELEKRLRGLSPDRVLLKAVEIPAIVRS